MNLDLKQYWPMGHARLLLRAAYHSDRAVALKAWREWEESVDFETAPWAELRVAAVAIRRLDEDAATSRFAPRLAGMRRFVWSSVITRIEGAKPLLQQLDQAGVPILLIKGAARIASDPAVVAERFIQDVDALIALDHWRKAIDVVFEHGYANAWNLDHDTFANRMHQVHHALGVIVSPPYEVDLHHFSIPLNRQLGADDDLWSRARPGSLSGVPVLLPHPSDQLAITLAHAIRYNPVRSYEWVGDAVTLPSTADFLWDLFEEVVISRELAALTIAPLAFLRDELGVPVPDALFTRVSGRVREPFLTELDAYHTGWGGEIDSERHCRAFMEAEVIRCSKAVPRLRPSSKKACRQSRQRTVTVRAAGSSFWLPVPAEIDATDVLRLDVKFRRLRAGHAEVLLRCFDDFILEFDRLDLAQRIGWRDILSSTMSIRIPGFLLLARGIVRLKMTVRPSEKRIWVSSYSWSWERSAAETGA